MSGATRSETTTATIETDQSVACTGWGPLRRLATPGVEALEVLGGHQAQEQQGGADVHRQRDRAVQDAHRDAEGDEQGECDQWRLPQAHREHVDRQQHREAADHQHRLGVRRVDLDGAE